MFLSACVFPGAGQAVQRRWGAAVVFGTLFGVFFGVFLFAAVRIIAQVYRFALNFNTAAVPEFSLARMTISFTGALLAYTASLLDVFLAGRRIARRSPTEA